MKEVRLIITGHHEALVNRAPSDLWGCPVIWNAFAVLEFKGLPSKEPPAGDWDWILFSSGRTVEYFLQLPNSKETLKGAKIGCVGASTAKNLSDHGLRVDYCPSVGAGSENFLAGFKPLVGSASRVLIPGAKKSRPLIAETLTQWGHAVDNWALYETVAKTYSPDELVRGRELVEHSHGIVMTSPSSVDAWLAGFPLGGELEVAALGGYTSSRLSELGIAHWVIPEGSFELLGNWESLEKRIFSTEGERQ